MSNLTTRAGKGSPLTNNELDANFTNLNADKVEIGGDLSGTSSAPNVAKIQGRAVSADAPAIGEKLVWNGTAWEPSADPTNEPIGHEDKSSSSISFNSGTRTFTISPVAANFVVWCKGVKYTYTSAQTVVIPDTTGLHFIYFNASGVLSTQMSYFTWEEHAPTAYVYWNATTQQAVYFGDERHGITLDWQTHEYLHRTRGAAIASGFGASGYTTTGAGATDADAQIDIGGGTFFDEDLQVDIVSTNTPVSGSWQQDLSGPARIPVLYLSGSAWVIDAPTDFPFKVVSGVPQYNLFSGGTWSSAPVANNGYFVSWILATHNLTYPVIAVISQVATNQVSEAEAMTFEGLTLSGFPSVEFRPLYKVIYQHKTSFANSIKASTIAVYDLRSIAAAGVAAALVQDHGNLSGLGDDDHAQYLHVSAVRSPSAAVTNSFLPSQASQSGKYLTTDGSNPSWGSIPSGSLTFTGDVTGSGTTGSSTTLTLSNSGASAGTYTKVTVDAKGRVTTGASINSSDVTTALGFTPENSGNKGVANGYASLDGAGKVPSTQLPSYVDDVLEYANLAAFPGTGESGKIYIAIDTVKTYRWSGSAYVEITSSPGSTDAVSEGSTNLYFTNARARGAITATGSLSYNNQTGVLSYTQPTNVSTFTNDSGYLTGITGTQVANALGYTPPQPNGTGASGTWGISISGNAATVSSITSGQVTTALGYTPYDSTNPSGYITSSSLSSYLPLSGGSLTGKIGWGTSMPNQKRIIGIYESGNLFTGIGMDSSNAGVRIAGDGSAGTLLDVGQYSTDGNYAWTSRLLVSTSYASFNGSTILHAGNYNSYSPTLTGGGAYGTWAISISGNAATATSATDSTKLPLSGGTLTGDLTLNGNNTYFGGNVYLRANSDFSFLTNSGSAQNGRFRGIQVSSSYSGAVPENGILFGTDTTLVRGASTYGSLLVGGARNGYWGTMYDTGQGNAGWMTNGNASGYYAHGHGWKYYHESGVFYIHGGTYGGGAVYTALHSGNYTSYAPSLTGSGASGTWGISVTGSAGSVGWANVSSGTRTGHGDIRFQPPESSYAGIQFLDTSGNHAAWMLLRGTSDTDVYTAEGLTIVADKGWLTLAQRSTDGKGVRLMSGVTSTERLKITTAGDIQFVNGNSFTYGGNAILHAGNYSSYSPTLGGSGATGNWAISISGSSNSVVGLTLSSVANGVNPDNVTQNQIGYNTSVNLFGQTDGGLYSSAYNSAWVHQIYGDFRTGQIAIRGKNSGTWQSWRTVLDSSNYTSYSPSLTGSGASGTWGINITGNSSGTLTGTLAASASANTIGRHLDATNAWGSPTTLFLGWYTGKVIIGNNNHSVHDPAFNGGSDVVYIGNPTFARNYQSFGNQDGTGNASRHPSGIYSTGTNWLYGTINMNGNTIQDCGRMNGPWTSGSRCYSNEWIEFGNYSGLYSPLNGAHFYPNNVTYGSWRVAGSRSGWHGLHFDSGSTLMVNSSEVGFHREGHGWQMWWSGGTGYVHKGNPGGGTQATILDSSNYTSYSPSLGGSGASGTWGINITGNAGSASNSSTVGGFSASTLRQVYGEATTMTFTVGGDANTYYPVIFNAGTIGYMRYSIWRYYWDAAPWDPIGTGSHKGGLTLAFSWAGDIAWGGNDKAWRIEEFHEEYTTMVAGMALPVTDGILVWLRGGSATYRFNGPAGVNHGITVHLGNYTAANGTVYAPRTNTSNVSSEILSKYPIRRYGDGDMYVSNNTVLHANNYSSYALPLSGGTVSGDVRVTNKLSVGGSATDLRFGVAGDTHLSGYVYLDIGGALGSYNVWSGRLYSTGGTTYINTNAFEVNRTGYGSGTLFYVNTSGASVNGNAVLHAGNYTSYAPSLTGSGASGTWSINITGNSGTVGGLSVHGGTNNEANKIVRTDGNGYIQAGWINTISGNLGSGNRLDRVWCSNDQYMRYLSLAEFKMQMGLSAKNTFQRHADYTSDQNYWVGSFGGSGLGANETFHGGSGFIDLWSGTNFPPGTSHIMGFNALHYTTNSFGSTGGNAYGIQVVGQYNQGGLLFSRACSGGSFSGWRRQIDDNNYTDYAVSITNNSSLNSDSRNSRGVTRLYRRDDNSDYSVQTYWTGSYWRLYGYAGDSGHADVHVGYADSAGSAGSVSGGITTSNYTSYTGGLSSVNTWTNTNYFRSNRNTTSSDPPLQAYSSDSGGAIMAFHRGGYYAVNFGLDSDNVIRIGGWSAGANRWQLDMSGNGTFAGNVTAYSDERLKKDWSPIYEGFVDRLAVIRAGTYTRIDSDERQAGVSAQAMREILPEVVSEDNEGTLALAYGNAAMVSAVELAKELVMLKKELAELKSRLN